MKTPTLDEVKEWTTSPIVTRVITSPLEVEETVETGKTFVLKRRSAASSTLDLVGVKES